MNNSCRSVQLYTNNAYQMRCYTNILHVVIRAIEEQAEVRMEETKIGRSLAVRMQPSWAVNA